MGIFLVIAGIILVSTNGWFADQQTVGEILLYAGGALILIQILIFVVIAILAAME